MEKEADIPLLLEFLYGEAAGRVLPAIGPRLVAWAEAFEAWLSDRGGAARRYEKEVAWRRLLDGVPKLPWEISQEEVAGHLAAMRAEGYSLSAIAKDRTRLAQFYEWQQAHARDPVEAGVGNPARGVVVPNRRPYDDLPLLSRSELEALLEQAGRDPSPVGRRDYAFFLLRMETGKHHTFLRELRWGQIEHDPDGSHWLRWRPDDQVGRYPAARCSLSGRVWEAIRAYLEASGRLEAGGGELPAEAYVFVPLNSSYQEGYPKGMAWNEQRCLSRSVILNGLKLYGKRVGIAPEKLNMESLRRTALRLRLEAGASLEEMQAFMDNQLKTRVIRYQLKTLPALPESGRRPEGEAPEPPVRETHRVEGNEGWRHGMFCRSLPEEAVQGILAEGITGVREEVRCLRELMRGLIRFSTATPDLAEKAKLGLAYTLCAERLQDLILLEKPGSEVEKAAAADEQALETMLKMHRIMAEKNGQPFDEEATRQDILRQALEEQDPLDLEARSVEEEIAATRYILRNLYPYGQEAREAGEAIHRVDLYSLACGRLARLLNRQRSTAGKVAAYFRAVVQEALRRIHAELESGM